MKRHPKLLLISLLMLPLVAWVIFSFARSQSAPSEAAMLANFKAHKSTFRKLAQMAESDGLQYVDAGSGTYFSATVPNPDHGLDLPDKRVEEYAVLMRQAGIKCMRGRGQAPLRFVIVSGQHGLMRDWSLGFCWAETYGSPSPIVVSAYKTFPKAPPFNPIFYSENFAYSKIEPNWFFYRSES